MSVAPLAFAVSAIIAAGLLGFAAWGAERFLVLLRFPVRWVWCGALVLSVAIPVSWVIGDGGARPLEDPALAAMLVDGIPGGSPIPGSPAASGRGPIELLVRMAAAAPSAVASAVGRLPEGGASALAIVWILLSLAFAGVLVGSVLRMNRIRGSWPLGQVEGSTVRVTRDHGPAVVGVRRPEVLVPGWILGLERDLLRLVLRHEEGHIRARDTQVLAGAVIPLVLMPWNLPLWWQFRRLRLAIELDCDRRVLGSGVDPTSYARALVEVGGRRVSATPYPAALFNPGPTLERRLRTMIEGVTTRRTVAAGFGLFLAVAAVAVACDTQPPARPLDALPDTVAQEAPEPVGIDAISQALERVRVAAENTAGSEWDEADWEEWTAELEERFRQYMEDRDAFMSGEGPDPGEFRIGGADMTADGTRIPGLQPDSSDLLGGSRLVRRPEEGVRVPGLQTDSSDLRGELRAVGQPGEGVYIELRTVTPDSSGSGMDAPPIPETEIAPPPPVQEEEHTGPVFTPFEVAPELANRREMERAMMREYPPVLRDAGIGGTVTLHFHISDQGEVLETVLAKSSGHAALDQAAEAVAEVMRFHPARNLDRDVAVWVQLSITFTQD